MNQDIYKALIADDPAFISGKDFIAMNYGRKYWGEQRLLRISGDKRSYESLTSEDKFPSNIFLKMEEPHIGLTESSHVGDFQTHKTKLTLDHLVHILYLNKMDFEKK